jgi:hypothetical protein
MTQRSSNRHDWLNLVEVSGPFLAVPVLEDVFPQGLDGLETARAQRLRRAYHEWREAVDSRDLARDDLHGAWIDEVLVTALEIDERMLRREATIPGRLHVALPEHGLTIAPDIAVVDPSHDDVSLLLVHVVAPDTDLNATRRFNGLAATPAERMAMLLRGAGCPTGLVTNGEHWMLVHAPVGSVASYASWYARLWGQEPETLRAFVSLLGVRRFFGLADERLPALFERSLKHQDDVTDALGEQVRRAVEVLVQAVDRADQDRNRELLRDTEPRVLYEAALTVMMRLVFLLAAEERGLLLLNDERYDQNYALSTLRMQLRGESDEILERRRSAWPRLLALFRAIYSGIEHPALRLPALGGSLFDPDSYPFLEGRTAGTSWRAHPAEPLPIDDRTVLLLLEAIQTFEGRTLSYRALDVEQIGHVYEGLLERTVKRVEDVTLELEASAKAKGPRVALGELESATLDGRERVAELLTERSQRSASAIRNALDRAPDERLNARLLTVCRGDVGLRDRILPYVHLLRTDPWDYPLVHHKGAFVVVLGADRRETGTHYTPKSLTEKIVEETLTPLVYRGPAEGESREAWMLKRPDELLDLKVCDPAMGSGAFLVQACRFLSERLVEAWARAEAEGQTVDVEGQVRAAGEVFEPMPSDVEERAVVARRLVAERCLYGVDMNPLAVELAKLSLWLTTLAKGRPFGFLDHHLKSGDSLLGIHDLRQLTELRIRPEGVRQLRLFGQSVERAVEEAVELRQLIASVSVRDIRDVEEMAALEAEAREKLRNAEVLADALVGTVFVGGSASDVETKLSSLAAEAERVVQGDAEARLDLMRRAAADLAKDALDGRPRRPFHWPLAFPEVYQRENGGFDAFVGNPPFLGNRLWKGAHGEGLTSIVQLVLGTSPGKIDLCVAFHRRATDLIRDGGSYGMLATSNIAEGSAITVGLGEVVKQGDIYFSRKGLPWPGKAATVVAIVCFHRGDWAGRRDADGQDCERIGPRLECESGEVWEPQVLQDSIFSFEGVNNSKGLAFVVTPDSPWFEPLKSEPASLLRPYITGNDITSYALNRIDRWALDIADRGLDEIRRCWPVAHRFLEEEVQPTRTPKALKSYKGLYERWWQFWNHRADLMRRLRQREHFIAYSKVTKYPICMLAPTNWIYTNKVLLIGWERDDLHAVCLSVLFRTWIEQYSGGNLGETLTLSISESVAKFPQPPTPVSPTGIEAAARFNDLAVSWSVEHDCGLTEVMNVIHTPTERDGKIVELRSLMQAIDLGVASAYGWDDLDISCDFHEVPYLPENDRVRFTISEPARIEVLRRLAELNRQRYEEEVAQGLHGKKSNKGGTRKQSTRTSAKQTKATSALQAGFHFEASPTRSSHAVDGEPAQAILNYLRAHPGWHAKSDVLGATGLTDGQWNTTIGDLVAQGHVERKGEKRGTRYRVPSERHDSPGEAA